MQRKQWFTVFLIFILTIIVDQYTKYYYASKPESWLGPLHFIVIHNHGAFLGSFSELSAFIRVVALSTIGMFILSIYLFLQYMIPKNIMKLRIGLSLLIGGIFGNVIDRIRMGYIIDFISFQIGSFQTPVWNVADMIQWVGYFLMSYSLIREGHLLWPDNNERLTFWVNKKFQIKFAVIFMITGLLISLASFVFSFTFLRVTLMELAHLENSELNKYTLVFSLSFTALILIFIMALFTIAKYVSHKIAGPVYAFERYLNQIFEKESSDLEKSQLRFRQGDEFRHLENVAENIKQKIIKIKTNQNL